jgi:hypothetical protein
MRPLLRLTIRIFQADVDRAPGLADDRTNDRIANELSDLVLDRGNGFLAEARVVRGELLLPELPHGAVAAASEEPLTVVVVDEQSEKVE